jgi:hypothetical protein
MSAFQAYAGAYEHQGASYSWRCYATARVYEIRHSDHGPFPKAPNGRKWIAPEQRTYDQLVGCLVDEGVEEFSQILLQVDPRPQPAARAGRHAPESVAAA